jgi:hypothetical protein
VRDLAERLNINLRYLSARLTDGLQSLDRAVVGVMKASC